ncbi:GIY-YIG nuclease family protein [Streptomyces sp. NPDC047967]|uniref:GIY-YIG nuclease family protein n=1 Tax=Streptomyces sp. NPDC047967 TaxID=3154924 RepID=UPI0033F615CB
MPSEEDPLQAFATQLRRFKIECGDPSLAKIARLSAKWKPELSKSSVGDVLNGKRMPGLDATMSLIRSLISNDAPSAQVSRDDPRLKEWRTYWSATKNQLDEIRRTAAARATPPSPGAAEQTPRTPTETPRPVPTREEQRTRPSSEAPFRPTTGELSVQRVQRFRSMLKKALDEMDAQGRKWADARYGCYAFFDYDGEPLYVGQSSERLGVRIRRHLVNQRSDAVAMGFLDVQEVAEMELWPLWDLQETERRTAVELLRRAEGEVYLRAAQQSRFGALLNERAPERAERVALPPSRRFALVDEQTRSEQGHADLRIARRAATAARLASLIVERGSVSDGARRALLLQSARLTHLAATHLAYVQGRPDPAAGLIDVPGLLGDDSLTSEDGGFSHF